jgi:uncharacterized protein YjbI with pentapeptide repeats
LIFLNNFPKVKSKQFSNGFIKEKPSGQMKKFNSKRIARWFVTTAFLLLVIGFSLLDQPNAKAQTQPPLLDTQFTPAPINSVTANVRHLLETNECVGCDLSKANLQSVNLQAANLEGANLYKADLEKANLQSTNLQAVNLQGADLSAANIAGANLERANLFDADLEKANLQAANLQGANLQKADLQKTNLIDANIAGADFRGTDIEEAIRPQGFIAQ